MPYKPLISSGAQRCTGKRPDPFQSLGKKVLGQLDAKDETAGVSKSTTSV